MDRIFIYEQGRIATARAPIISAAGKDATITTINIVRGVNGDVMV